METEHEAAASTHSLSFSPLAQGKPQRPRGLGKLPLHGPAVEASQPW